MMMINDHILYDIIIIILFFEFVSVNRGVNHALVSGARAASVFFILYIIDRGDHRRVRLLYGK